MPELFVPFAVIAGIVSLCVIVARWLKPPEPLSAHSVAAFLERFANRPLPGSVATLPGYYSIVGSGWRVVIASEPPYWVKAAFSPDGRTFTPLEADPGMDPPEPATVDPLALMDDDARMRLMGLFTK